MTATREAIAAQLGDLGVERGGVLVVHCSFRAVGPVDGGPVGLIEALQTAVGSDGTLVMPSMTDWDDDELFEPDETPCLDMGVVADTFWLMPDVLRSDSPHSFAARGPTAAQIVAPHPPDLPHGPDSPVGRAHDLDAQVLLLGVDHDANTTIHLAEFLAGVPYRVSKFCTVLADGVETRVDYGEIDHCCRNFRRVGEWLSERHLEERGPVGQAVARLARSRDIVAAVAEELTGDNCRFLCARSTGCAECDEAWSSVGGAARSTIPVRSG